jgi:membrane protease YdiL (CAAX protease family)
MENEKNTFPVWTDILSIVGVFFLTGLLTGAVVLAAGVDGSGWGLFAAYTGQFALTIAYTVFRIRRQTGKPALAARLTLRGFDPAVILWGVLLMLAVSVVIEPVLELFPSEWYDWVGERIKHGGWAMATAVIAAPICEEVLFRGLIQTALVRKRGPWAGILIASALFGIIHLIPQQVVAGFLLGMIIGLVYYKTRSLAAAIGLHLINNALATFLSLFEPEGGPSPTLRELIGSDAVYWTIFAASALLVILSLIRVIRTIQKGRAVVEKTEEKA